MSSRLKILFHAVLFLLFNQFTEVVLKDYENEISTRANHMVLVQNWPHLSDNFIPFRGGGRLVEAAETDILTPPTYKRFKRQGLLNLLLGGGQKPAKSKKNQSKAQGQGQKVYQKLEVPARTRIKQPPQQSLLQPLGQLLGLSGLVNQLVPPKAEYEENIRVSKEGSPTLVSRTGPKKGKIKQKKVKATKKQRLKQEKAKKEYLKEEALRNSKLGTSRFSFHLPTKFIEFERTTPPDFEYEPDEFPTFTTTVFPIMEEDLQKETTTTRKRATTKRTTTTITSTETPETTETTPSSQDDIETASFVGATRAPVEASEPAKNTQSSQDNNIETAFFVSATPGPIAQPEPAKTPPPALDSNIETASFNGATPAPIAAPKPTKTSRDSNIETAPFNGATPAPIPQKPVPAKSPPPSQDNNIETESSVGATPAPVAASEPAKNTHSFQDNNIKTAPFVGATPAPIAQPEPAKTPPPTQDSNIETASFNGAKLTPIAKPKPAKTTASPTVNNIETALFNGATPAPTAPPPTETRKHLPSAAIRTTTVEPLEATALPDDNVETMGVIGVTHAVLAPNTNKNTTAAKITTKTITNTTKKRGKHRRIVKIKKKGKTTTAPASALRPGLNESAGANRAGFAGSLNARIPVKDQYKDFDSGMEEMNVSSLAESFNLTTNTSTRPVTSDKSSAEDYATAKSEVRLDLDEEDTLVWFELLQDFYGAVLGILRTEDDVEGKNVEQTNTNQSGRNMGKLGAQNISKTENNSSTSSNVISTLSLSSTRTITPTTTSTKLSNPQPNHLTSPAKVTSGDQPASEVTTSTTETVDIAYVDSENAVDKTNKKPSSHETHLNHDQNKNGASYKIHHLSFEDEEETQKDALYLQLKKGENGVKTIHQNSTLTLTYLKSPASAFSLKAADEDSDDLKPHTADSSEEHQTPDQQYQNTVQKLKLLFSSNSDEGHEDPEEGHEVKGKMAGTPESSEETKVSSESLDFIQAHMKPHFTNWDETEIKEKKSQTVNPQPTPSPSITPWPLTFQTKSRAETATTKTTANTRDDENSATKSELLGIISGTQDKKTFKNASFFKNSTFYDSETTVQVIEEGEEIFQMPDDLISTSTSQKPLLIIHYVPQVETSKKTGALDNASDSSSSTDKNLGQYSDKNGERNVTNVNVQPLENPGSGDVEQKKELQNPDSSLNTTVKKDSVPHDSESTYRENRENSILRALKLMKSS